MVSRSSDQDSLELGRKQATVHTYVIPLVLGSSQLDGIAMAAKAD